MPKEYLTINDWPKKERPREKLLRNGEHLLSDSELLAIILRTGAKGENAVDLARRILHKFDGFGNMGQADFCRLKEIKGLGEAKIAQIKATIEIGRRIREEKTKVSSPIIKSSGDVFRILSPRMGDLRKEVFKVMFLTAQNRIIDILEIEEGTVNEAKPIIREVFQKALQQFASFVICAHNHPSGDPQPSQEDKDFTRALVLAGDALLLKCLDHIIIGGERYFSFSDEGLI